MIGVNKTMRPMLDGMTKPSTMQTRAIPEITAR